MSPTRRSFERRSEAASAAGSLLQARRGPARQRRFSLGRRRQQAFSLRALSGQLVRSSYGFRLLPGLPLGRLLMGPAGLHLAEDAFPLHLLLQNPEGLFDIVVAHEYLHRVSLLAHAVHGRCGRPKRRTVSRHHSPSHGKGDKGLQDLRKPVRSLVQRRCQLRPIRRWRIMDGRKHGSGGCLAPQLVWSVSATSSLAVRI